MVAVGGSIGTGLLLGSAGALEIAGPAVILSYVLAAIIAWTVSMALGELSSVHPAAGSFGVYGDLYLNPWAGFIARAGYWAAIAISIGAELVASAIYMGYWFPAVPGVVWVVVFSAFLLLVNARSVGDYGRFEYWFAMIKLATMAVFVAVGAGLLIGHRMPTQYTTHGGFLPNGPFSPLLAMFFALYAFGGVEMLAVTTGESKSAGDVPRAYWTTFLVLAAIYIGAITVLVGVMPWNHAGVTESPFVTVFRQVHVPAAGHFMNFVVLTAALSGANACFYVSSRMLFSLARTGWAPRRLGALNRAGSPSMAVIASSYGIVVALVLEKWAPAQAFVSILGAAFTGLMLSWIVSLAAHISFRRRLSKEQVRALPMRSPAGGWGSMVGLLLVLAACAQTWRSSRLNLFSGAACIVLLTIAYWVLKKSAAESRMSS